MIKTSFLVNCFTLKFFEIKIKTNLFKVNNNILLNQTKFQDT
jgi:hypothetical protein